MARRAPPDDCPSPLGPIRETLPIGTVLWRIHWNGFEPTGFNPRPATGKREPGRFDSIDGDFAYLYAGETRRTVFAEVFLRGETVLASTVRIVPRRRLENLRLSRLVTAGELELVLLIGAEALGRIGQDAWLTSCDEHDYPLTEEYARTIRRWAPWAAGLVWLAKRDNAHRSYVLFADRVMPTALSGEMKLELDGDGEAFTRGMLARLSVALEDPAS